MGDHKDNGINIDPAFVRALAELLDDTQLSEIEVEDGDRKVRVARTLTAAPIAYAPAPVAARPAPPEDIFGQMKGAWCEFPALSGLECDGAFAGGGAGGDDFGDGCRRQSVIGA